MRLSLPVLAFALLVASGLRAGPHEILVYDSVTAAGKIAPKPSAVSPVVYLLQLGGYKQIADVTAGEKAVSPEEVASEVHAAMMSQGFEPIRKTSTRKPDIYVVVHWGYMGPGDTDFGDGNTVSFNEGQMVALVAGKSIDKLDVDSLRRTDLMEAAHETRYFIVLSAYDYPAMEKHQKVLLWQARMSTPVNRTDLTTMVPFLAKAGAASFGKETSLPKAVMVNDVPEGTVKIGTAVPVADPPKPVSP